MVDLSCSLHSMSLLFSACCLCFFDLTLSTFGWHCWQCNELHVTPVLPLCMCINSLGKYHMPFRVCLLLHGFAFFIFYLASVLCRISETYVPWSWQISLLVCFRRKCYVGFALRQKYARSFFHVVTGFSASKVLCVFVSISRRLSVGSTLLICTSWCF